MLKVYRKESKFDKGEFYYSATRADGSLVNIVFTKDSIEIPDAKAFGMRKIKGQPKEKTIEKDGQTYTNFTYYVTECEFCDMPSIDLDE